MRYATFNVLADVYTNHGDYSHADPKLMQPGARLGYVCQLINRLEAEVVALQEVDRPLAEVFENDEKWQSFWTPKGRNKPDGCLTLVRSGVDVAGYESHLYDDGSGHVFQLTRISEIAIANTHMKWAPEDDRHHIGVRQAQELLTALGSSEAAVILADCNGRPGGRVQNLVARAGFMNLCGESPTAIVNGQVASIDLLAIRGLGGMLIPGDYDLHTIPNRTCASDHIPVVAEIVSK